MKIYELIVLVGVIVATQFGMFNFVEYLRALPAEERTVPIICFFSGVALLVLVLLIMIYWIYKMGISNRQSDQGNTE